MNKMTLSEELAWRGLVKDTTFADHAWLNDPKAFYLGVDVGSADSMTIGNLAVFLLARRLLDAGWKTVLLVGGATSLVGDPGGKDEERPLVSREEVEKNKAGIKAQVEKLFAGKDFTPVDNYDWFKDVLYLEFLREVGKHFSVTELMQRDFVADRVGETGSGISYAEFSYSLVQGYDYLQLFKREKTVLQIGGSDQWGNILSGVSLIRKKENAEVHAMSMPLVVNKSTGKKFGKSEEGAVWLDPNKTSVYKFYQFWLNLDDEGVEDYLKIYTLLDKEVVDSTLAEFKQNPGGRLAQKTLAYEVTKLVHGENAAETQKRVAEVLFGGRSVQDLTREDFQELLQILPSASASRKMTVDVLIDALVATSLASSKTEARRFIADGAIYINDQQVRTDDLTVFQYDEHADYAVVRRGKNNNAVLKIT